MAENAGDSTDGGCYGTHLIKNISKIFKKSIPAIDGSVESPDYALNFPMKGKCLILSQKKFDKKDFIKDKNGTDEDVLQLYCRFKELGFETEFFTDLSVKKVLSKLKKAGKVDYSQSACFVCCVLTHGSSDVLFASDGKYPTEQVFSPFQGNKCPSLLGKPKIFFIQACQEERLDSGRCRESTDASDNMRTFRIPSQADFLFVYSTAPGFYSEKGSWFIQTLCSVLKECDKSRDFLELLTIVNKKIIYDYENGAPESQNVQLKSQVPLIISTLTRKVKL